MSQLFKNPVTTPGLLRTAFAGTPDIAAKFAPSPPPPPAMLMPAPPGDAKVGYSSDDPRWKSLQKAGAGDTILSAPGAVYAGTKLGG